MEASEDCEKNRPAARPGTRTVAEEKEEDSVTMSNLKVNASLNAANGIYSVLLASESLPVIRTISRNTTVTKRCNPSPPPENSGSTISTEMPIVAASEEKPWTTGEYVSGSCEVNDDEEGGKMFLPGENAGGSGNYSKRSILSWDLKRKESECTAKVKSFKGDATLNDMPLEGFSGEVPLSNGDRIKSGAGSRIQLQIPGANAVYRFGSDTDFVFKRDPCDAKNTKDVTSELMTGSLFSVISKLSGRDLKIQVQGMSKGGGVRGFFKRLHDFFEPITLYATETDQNPIPENAVLPNDMGSGDAAFYLWATPDGAVGVKIFYGRAIVEDHETGKTVNLTAGESYHSSSERRSRPALVRIMK